MRRQATIDDDVIIWYPPSTLYKCHFDLQFLPVVAPIETTKFFFFFFRINSKVPPKQKETKRSANFLCTNEKCWDWWAYATIVQFAFFLHLPGDFVQVATGVYSILFWAVHTNVFYNILQLFSLLFYYTQTVYTYIIIVYRHLFFLNRFIYPSPRIYNCICNLISVYNYNYCRVPRRILNHFLFVYPPISVLHPITFCIMKNILSAKLILFISHLLNADWMAE